jgi:DNA polymerase III subunit chi
MTTSVNFLKVADNQSKAIRICACVQHHFDKGSSILITVNSLEVAKFVDLLLWRLPEDSFLPHVIAEQISKEMVVITTLQENLNNASILLNLCTKASPIAAQFQTVYELLDETHPEKLLQSQKRIADYSAAGFAIKQT